MADNDATNGHTEAATDLEKKIIKQIEVSQCVFATFISKCNSSTVFSDALWYEPEFTRIQL